MAEQNISKLVMGYVYRDVITDCGTQTLVADRFIDAKTQTAVVNLIGYALGYVSSDVADLRRFESDDLLEPKMRKQVLAIVDRMPSWKFMFIPLVLVQEGKGVSIMPLLRVCKPSNKGEETVFLDVALRLYDSFPEFLENNKLPPCQLWYPTYGLIRFDADGKLLLSRCTIKKRNDGVWKGIAIAGNIAATGLVLTPVAPVAAPFILLASNLPLIGFSIADLVDGCKYERGTVVASRTAALVVNLVTFSTVGLTAACKVPALRNLLPAEKLLLLERAETIMKVSTRTVSSANAVYSIISSAAGWQELTASEWVQVAVNLCFAFHEVISEANAIALWRNLQMLGLVKFFKNACPNVIPAQLTAKLSGWFEPMLELVLRYLQTEAVQFTVDDDFTTIRLFGYEIRFETLVQLNKDAVHSLLLYLQDYIAPLRKLSAAATGSFTQEVLFALMELFKLVCQLKNVPYMLRECIVIGKGHQFSFGTLLAWWNAPAHDRLELIRDLVSLDDDETKQLNEIRATRLGGCGDAGLFRWLVSQRSKFTTYRSALDCLLHIATLTEKEPIVFDGNEIVISSLRSLSAEEWSPELDKQCLYDTRFLQLCKDAEDNQHSPSKVRLLERAKRVWTKTCRRNQTWRQLETISLLEKLFTHSTGISPPFTLAEALDYAMDFGGATVGVVYYSILFAWQVQVQEKHATFDRATMMARFNQQMTDASALRMDRCVVLNKDSQSDGTDDNRLIEIARGATRFIHYGENCKQMEELYFDSSEKAACWLQLLPALRNKEGRGQFNSTLRYLLKKGNAKVLINEEDSDGDEDCPRYVMFYSGKTRVVLQMRPSDRQWYASVHLCSLSFTTKSNTSVSGSNGE